MQAGFFLFFFHELKWICSLKMGSFPVFLPHFSLSLILHRHSGLNESALHRLVCSLIVTDKKKENYLLSHINTALLLSAGPRYRSFIFTSISTTSRATRDEEKSSRHRHNSPTSTKATHKHSDFTM